MKKLSLTGFSVALALGFFGPLMNPDRSGPFQDFYGEFMTVLWFLLAALFFIGQLPKKIKLSLAPLGIFCAMAVLLLMQWQLGFTHYILMQASALFFLIIFYVFFFLGRNASEAPETRTLLVDRLCWGIILLASVNVLLQTMQSMGIQTTAAATNFLGQIVASTCRPGGNLWQSNHANTVAIVGFSAVIYLWRSAQSISTRFALPLILWLLWGSALAASRMGWIQIGFFCALINCFPSHLNLKKETLWKASALFILVFLALNQLPGLLFGADCLSATARFTDGTNQGNWYRLDLIRQALMVWQSAPILGVGIGQFIGKVYFLGIPLNVQHAFDFYTHNIPLQILAETGLVGFILIIGALLCLARNFWKVLKPREIPKEYLPMLAWVLILSIHSMLEFPLYYLYMMIPFAIALGVLSGAYVSRNISVNKYLAAFVIIPLIACSLWTFGDYQNTKTAAYSINASIGAPPNEQNTQRIKGLTQEVHLFRPYLDYLMLQISPLPDKQGAAQALKEHQHILQNYPHPTAIIYQAILESKTGDMAAAEITLRRLQVFLANKATDTLQNLIKELDRRQGEEFSELAEIARKRLLDPPTLR